MSLYRRDAKRDANEPVIRKAVHDVGAVTWQLREPCDLLVLYEGVFRTFEVKDGDKPPSARQLTPAEREYAEVCRYHHGPHFVVTSITEALQALGVIR